MPGNFAVEKQLDGIIYRIALLTLYILVFMKMYNDLTSKCPALE